uniref:Uncharacterized protein n=1 Tax=Romanomermis culicivorax TaxID=13658 RepID=A0A915JEE0_ROMCU
MRHNSLTSLIDDQRQKSCALLSCKKLSSPSPPTNVDEFTDTLLAAASSAFVTAADNITVVSHIILEHFGTLESFIVVSVKIFIKI